MALTARYWSRVWDNAKSDSRFDENAGKTLSLLANYAGFSKLLIAFDVQMHWGGTIGRFFFGRRHDQYRTQVEMAIKNFYQMSGEHLLTRKFHTVDFILAIVKSEMGNARLDPNDNLSKILEVIQEKTHIDYASLDAEVIINAREGAEERRANEALAIRAARTTREVIPSVHTTYATPVVTAAVISNGFFTPTEAPAVSATAISGNLDENDNAMDLSYIDLDAPRIASQN